MDKQQLARAVLDAAAFHEVLTDSYGPESPEARTAGLTYRQALAAAADAGVTGDDVRDARNN